MNGKILTFGSGRNGELGHSTLRDCVMPKIVQSLNEEFIVYAAGGRSNSIAITSNGEVYVWGNGIIHIEIYKSHIGTKGQLGLGSTIQQCATPKKLNMFGHGLFAIRASAGYFHSGIVTGTYFIIQFNEKR